MTNNPQKSQLSHPPAAPPEFAGQWVAWNKERTKIVAHGDDMAFVHRSAIAIGHPNAILQHVRRPEVTFIGTT
jgi:hypothetical protein